MAGVGRGLATGLGRRQREAAALTEPSSEMSFQARYLLSDFGPHLLDFSHSQTFLPHLCLSSFVPYILSVPVLWLDVTLPSFNRRHQQGGEYVDS